ncbi:MAG TPA: ankyrin repeat domain-containing protein [Taishania sp.]|nr:ankyrin repeat domain-containing protein [Taishania sp.]
MLKTALLVFTTLSFGLFGQEKQKNELLNRAFWSQKPTLELVKQKIAEGNDPTEYDGSQFDPTTLAINTKASNDIILHLLSFKENHANKITHDGRTYIFWAASQGNIPIIEELVKMNANLKHVDEKGFTPLIFAASNGQKDLRIYDLFISKGADIKNERSPAGASALMLLSSTFTSMKDAQPFIDKGLSLKDKDEKGNNIFAYASRGGKIDFLNELIKAGIDPKNIATDGANAFIMATQGTRTFANNLEFYKYLEGLGINPNVSTKDGLNPLHNLARGKDAAVVTYFIEKGCDVNQPNKNGDTPLMLAAGGQKDLELFDLLLKRTKDINLKNKEGQTALTHAVISNDTKVGLLLINNGADVNVVDNEGNNLSFYLIKHARKMDDYQAKLKMLNAFGFQNNKIQGNGNTLYHLAVLFKKMDILKTLAEDKSIDINKANDDSMTPLHIAASMDDSGEMLQLLLELGADKSIKTEFDETAYDLAKENELLTKNKIDLSFLK